MHIIIIGVLLLVIVFLLSKVLRPANSSNSSATALPDASTSGHAPLAVAFIAEGKLFHQAAGGQIKQIHSPYVQDMIDKVAKSRERNAWKKGTSFEISANNGMRDFDANNSQVVTTSVYFDQSDTLVYFLSDQVMGGLFTYDLANGTERRMMHKQNLCLIDLHPHPSSGQILAASVKNDGITNLAVMQNDGSGYKEITSGDTVDSAPVWVPGIEQQIIFQSSGIARSPQGHVLAYSNISLQMLDMATGEISEVAQDPAFDFILPRFCARGNLLFIRRPYETPKYEASNFLLDTLLFPFRLLRAIFHWLNFFSMMYTRKPLTSASGPTRQADIKEILLKGKRINAEKALRDEAQVNGIASLVPKSWQLISRNRQGVEQVLASNVASFDVNAQGQILYSNGRAVFALGDKQESKLVLKSDLVAEVAAQKATLPKPDLAVTASS